jgi:hypothetical protein
MTLSKVQKLLGEAERMAKNDNPVGCQAKIKAARVIIAQHIARENKGRLSPHAKRIKHRVTPRLTK